MLASLLSSKVFGGSGRPTESWSDAQQKLDTAASDSTSAGEAGTVSESGSSEGVCDPQMQCPDLPEDGACDEEPPVAEACGPWREERGHTEERQSEEECQSHRGYQGCS